MNRDVKEIINNMEFLMKELHKEWDRSGITKASVIISIDEVEVIKKVLMMRIAKVQVITEEKTKTFKESICLSRDCYVLLRLAKKIIAKEDKTNQKGMDVEFSIPLDKEELKLFKEMFGSKVE